MGNDPSLTYDFDGLIDDVRIYNRALSADEVGRLYNSGQVRINTSNRPGTLADGLVGHWTMDGGDINWATGTITDRSGQGNHGNLANMSTTTAPTIGKIGQALAYDGTNDFIYLGGSAEVFWSNSQPRSISFWIYMKKVSPYPTVAAFKTSGPYGFSVYISSLAGRQGVNWGYSHLDFMGKTDGDISGSFLNNWKHVVITSDGVSTTTVSGYKVYVDGLSLPFSKSSTSWTTNNITYTNRIGYWPSTDYVLDGKIDDFRIYNRVLSQSEVKQLYNLGR